MTFQIHIPGSSEPFVLRIESGSSAVIVGANGGGKTRLAVFVENQLKLNAHRISAHRALALNTTVPKISEREALQGLTTGFAKEHARIEHRTLQRWHKNEAISLLDDFDFLIQALFADQTNKSLATHQHIRAGGSGPAEPTRLEQLAEIWDRLLPHRKLHLSGDNIEVVPPPPSPKYSASEMSDGERAIFYLIGQTLMAQPNTLLIFDEPELHVHRSILAKLWDELEGSRPDCAFLFITHDLEFAAGRVAQKFVIQDYDPTPRWAIETVPENTGFSEETATLILGSRRPILFVEGDENSLYITIYRSCFSDWTVIPRGSCEEVMHSVVTLRKNSALTRVTCSGLVDADDYQPEDVAYLKKLGIAVLPVSEIENVILIPSVSRAIAKTEGYGGSELEVLLETLKTEVFNTLREEKSIETVVARYCRRRIDRTLKKIDLSEAKTVKDIAEEYNKKTSGLDIRNIAKLAADRIESAINDRDLPKLLANYDNKLLITLAASRLKKSRRTDFESWLARVLRNNSVPTVAEAIKRVMPDVRAD